MTARVRTTRVRCETCKGVGFTVTRQFYCTNCGGLIPGRAYKDHGRKYCSIECLNKGVRLCQ